MIDHLAIDVADLDASRAFYEAALAPLGLHVRTEIEGGVLFGGRTRTPGEDPAGEFAIVAGSVPEPRPHVAFRARSRAEVDAFHRAALAAGGRDNGGPGLRPRYHADYYAAFVYDPDGYNVEAVCHLPA